MTGIKNNVKTYHSILGDQPFSKNPYTEKNQGQIEVIVKITKYISKSRSLLEKNRMET